MTAISILDYIHLCPATRTPKTGNGVRYRGLMSHAVHLFMQCGYGRALHPGPYFVLIRHFVDVGCRAGLGYLLRFPADE